MAINFPTGLDSLTRYVDGSTVMIASTLNNMQLAIEAMQAKVGIDSSVVVTSHDYKITQLESGVLVESGATVFNAAMTIASQFQTLDLSGTIGAKATLVHLEVRIPAGSGFYAVKNTSYGSATFTDHYNGGGNPSGGTVATAEAGSTSFADMIVTTNGNGHLSHGHTNNTTSITVKLIAYIQ